MPEDAYEVYVKETILTKYVVEAEDEEHALRQAEAGDLPNSSDHEMLGFEPTAAVLLEE